MQRKLSLIMWFANEKQLQYPRKGKQSRKVTRVDPEAKQQAIAMQQEIQMQMGKCARDSVRSLYSVVVRS